MYDSRYTSAMSTSRARTSRVFTISFPESLAKQVEETAREESRNVSELFREAWRAYQFSKIEKRVDLLRQQAPKTPYTPDDIETLVHEMRNAARESEKT